MSKRLQAQVNQYIDDPRVQGFLNVIAKAEGTADIGQDGYNVLFGGNTFDSYNTHPNRNKRFRQTDGQTRNTTAAGRYQFLNRTWTSQANKLGLEDFSPRSQDKAALGLIIQRGALDDILEGRTTEAVQKLGREWASLPSSPYPQPTRRIGQINEWLAENALPPVTTNTDVVESPQEATTYVDNATTETSAMPLSGVEPVSFVAENGQNMIAIPENPMDMDLLQATRTQAPYDRGIMMRVNEQIAQATTPSLEDVSLFDPYPTYFDSQLRELINTVEV